MISDIFTVKSAHVTFLLWGTIFCFIASAIIALSKGIKKGRKIILICIEHSAGSLLFMDAIAWAFRGHIGTLGHYAVTISNFLVFLFSYVVGLWYSAYVISYVFPEKLTPKNFFVPAGKVKLPAMFYVAIWSSLAGIVLTVITQFTGFLYYIDGINLYHRNTMYPTGLFVGMIPVAADFLILLKYRKKIQKRVFTSLLSYVILPFAGMIALLFTYGISCVNIGIGISSMYIFYVTVREQDIELYEDAKIITSMQEGIIMDFANMVECRDQNTGDHIKRTSLYVKTIVDEMMKKKIYRDELTPTLAHNMVKAAPLHDIGKIKISDSILNKPGKLTEEEFEIMKTHTTEGMKILSETLLSTSGSGYLKESIDMAWCHHEWWNGKGYPRGLKGEEIPLSARVMAVADVFDALLSKRSYKEAYSFDKAVSILKNESGSHFDPLVVAAFLNAADFLRDALEFILPGDR
ncbi:MAG: HD domain-containing protein [Treponema sp.]|nr:HD domain-containing protein [Treponema sp.]MBR4386884.1 HD domain-containing protein [Treponema sp.]